MGFKSDPRRDASAVIRGFVYQVDVSVHRWLNLQNDEALELEAGEDLDLIQPLIGVEGGEARLLEQVKDLSRSISLRSRASVTSIARFLEHRQRNPGVALSYRFLTTASIAKENDSPLGTHLTGIEAWESLRTGNLSTEEKNRRLRGLRDLLASSTLPKKLGEGPRALFWKFWEDATDQEALELMTSFEWSCAEPGHKRLREQVIAEIREMDNDISEANAKSTFDALFLHTLHLLAAQGPKQLTPEDRNRILASPMISNDDLKLLATVDDQLEQLWVKVDEQEHRLGRAEDRLADHEELLLSFASPHTQRAQTWEDIVSWSMDCSDEIRRDLAGNFVLGRTSQLESLKASLAKCSTTILLGESGCGKSSLVLQSANEGHLVGHLIFLDAREVATTITSHGKVWVTRFAEALRPPSEEAVVLCLDGLEQLDASSLSLIARLIASLDQRPQSRGRCLILTCEQHDWPRVQRVLRRERGMPQGPGEVLLSGLDDADRKALAEAFPELERLIGQLDLHPILDRLKVLDMLLSISATPLTATGGSTLSDTEALMLWWDDLVLRHDQSSSAGDTLIQLAEEQARCFSADIAHRPLQLASEGIGDLLAAHIITLKSERVRIHHRLYADVARMRGLLAYSSTPGEIARRVTSIVTNPLWHNGFRLYFAHQSHVAPEFADALVRALQAQASSDGKEALDHILDAILLGSAPSAALDKLAEVLFESGGRLLRRTFERLTLVASVPDEALIGTLSDQLPADELARYQRFWRVPDRATWPATISWMLKNTQRVFELGGEEAMEIAARWLEGKAALEGVPFKREIADAVLDWLEPTIRDNHALPGRVRGKWAIWAITRAFTIRPERVGPLLEILAGLHILPEAEKEASEGQPLPPQYAHLFKRHRQPYDADGPVVAYRKMVGHLEGGALPPPWADGPMTRPDRTLREQALEHNALLPLISSDPMLAARLLLALMIEPPQPEDDWTDRELWDDLAVTKALRVEPSPYWLPLYSLLRRHPRCGVEVVLKLTQHATDRWYEWRWETGRSEGNPKTRVGSITLQVDGEAIEFRGGRHLIYWHRANPWAPSLVVTALMCLELFLYDLIDELGTEDEGLLGLVTSILLRTRSVAVLGVLASLAKRHSELLDTCLEPLVTSPWLMLWSQPPYPMIDSPNDSALMSIRTFASEITRAQLTKWHQLKHRELSLYEAIWTHFLLWREGDWPVLEHAASGWRDEPQAHGPAEAHRAIIEAGRHAQQEHWRRVDIEEDDLQLCFVGKLPRSEQEKADGEQARRSLVIRHFPLRCRNILSGAAPLNQTDPSLLWVEACGLVESWPEAMREEGLLVPLDVLAPAMAVLISEFDWELLDTAGIAQEHLAIFSRLAESHLFSMDGFERAQIGNLHWSVFLGEALAPAFARFPGRPDLRRLAAMLSVGIRRPGIKHWFDALSRCLGPTNPMMRKLLSLGLEAARLEVLLGVPDCSRVSFVGKQPLRTELPGHPELSPQFRENVLRRLESLIDAFEADLVAPLPEAWSEILKTWPEGLQPPEAFSHAPHFFDGASEPTLCSLFSWVPNVEPESADAASTLGNDLKELVRALSITRQAHQLRENQRTPQAPNEVAPELIAAGRAFFKLPGYPTTIPNYPIQRLGPRLMETAAKSILEEIVAPLFDATYLDSWLISELMRAALKARLTFLPPPPDTSVLVRGFVARVIPTLEAMGTARSRLWYYRLALSALGIDHWMMKHWTRDHGELVVSIAPSLKAWLKSTCGSSECLSGFLVFLKDSEASAPIRLEAMTWLSALTPGVWRSHGRAVDQLMSFVEALWRDHKAPISETEAHRRAFQELLAIGRRRDRPIAHEISRALAAVIALES